MESISIHKGWLWLVTSHARTRTELRDDDEGSSDVEAFAFVEFHPRRYALGRIPLIDAGGGMLKPVKRDGEGRAWCVPATASGSALTEALARDNHLKRALAIPAKENGLDIEGIAVRDGRVVFGLRGPVLRLDARADQGVGLQVGSLVRRATPLVAPDDAHPTSSDLSRE